MKLPSPKRLYESDYSDEDREFIEQLSIPFNGNIEPLYEALNKKLSLSDNFLGTDATFTVELNSDGTPKSTTSFKLDFTGKARHLYVGKVDNLTNSNIYPFAAPFITFSQNNDIIVIKHITGLTTGYKYRINVIALG